MPYPTGAATRSSRTKRRWPTTGRGRTARRFQQREFTIVQASPTKFWPELNDSRFRRWAIEFATALLARPVEFWYDQFLAKPPAKGAATLWHQDEGYWGRHLDDRGLTCWMPFHDVDERNGCMHFVDGGHRDGILEHHHPDDIQSDLLFCRPDETRAVAVPLTLGSVTFHHGKTPHDHRQPHRPVAQDPHPAPPHGGHRG